MSFYICTVYIYKVACTYILGLGLTVNTYIVCLPPGATRLHTYVESCRSRNRKNQYMSFYICTVYIYEVACTYILGLGLNVHTYIVCLPPGATRLHTYVESSRSRNRKN